ncbi:hypothetical protein MA16_Dca025616 [Dendrobium catenatum]|uniref:Uncharacterized protein n=1 Tax=Dendrobium catenatum TaxID=906689 RepID=A0A2I0W160_9ASPA|nr:hypothetical protein MA16_Dca025616 [Dendrobium catenatum]
MAVSDNPYHCFDDVISNGTNGKFHDYRIELPEGKYQLAQDAKYLIEALCLPFHLHDILTIVSNGPFVGQVDARSSSG